MSRVNLSGQAAIDEDPLGIRHEHVPGVVNGRPKSSTKVTIALWCILVFAISVRLLVFIAGPSVNIKQAYEPDSRRYVELGQTLKEYGTFARGPED